jgi:hypothetical protein
MFGYNSLFDEHYPKDPNFYYYKIQGNGKRFYFKHNDKLVPSVKILPEILRNIKEYNKKYSHLDDLEKLSQIEQKCNHYVDMSRKYRQCQKKLSDDIALLKKMYGNEIEKVTERDPEYYYYRTKKNKKMFYRYCDYRSMEDYGHEMRIFDRSHHNIRTIEKICKNSLIPFDNGRINPFDERYEVLGKVKNLAIFRNKMERQEKMMENIRPEKEQLSNRIDKSGFYMTKSGSDNLAERVKLEKINLQKEYKKEKKEKFNKFFSTSYSWYQEPPKQEKKDKVGKEALPDPSEVLKSYKITDKKSWKNWLRENHPDKGGNEEDCKKVISSGRSLGY